MAKEITKTEENLIITIPRFTNRSNPYDEDFSEKMDNVIGLWEGEYNNGLAYRIDMQYKDKSDQCSDYFYKTNCGKEEFEQICKDLEIDIYYM